MSIDISGVIKSESCFITSSNSRFVHDLFLNSYVIKTKPSKAPLFVCTRIIAGLHDETREEQSNIISDFFVEENSVWLRDFVLTNQCYLKLTIWNEEDQPDSEEKSNYIYFEEKVDSKDENILFFVDDSLRKRVYPKFFARHEEIQ
jgi:hypothetical protein